jgi:hypothetical protein
MYTRVSVHLISGLCDCFNSLLGKDCMTAVIVYQRNNIASVCLPSWDCLKSLSEKQCNLILEIGIRTCFFFSLFK